MLKRYEIDGNDFSNLTGFYEEFSRVVIPDQYWGHNLDALNDVLSGGMGTPDEGFILVWKNSNTSRERLSSLYKDHKKTEFELLLEIFRDHSPDGKYENDNVQLILD